MFRVLVSSPTFRTTPGPHHDQLKAAGCELVPSPYPRATREEELLPLIPDFDAVIASTDTFTERVFAAAPRLRLIARFGVGYDAIDLAAATRHRVWVTTTPGTNHHSVADHTLALLLALVRQVVPLVDGTRAGKWERTPGVELAGKTLGIIGLGRIGREVARRATGFGLRVIAYDMVEDAAAAAALGASYVGLEELLAQSDFISMHVPLTTETRHLLDTRRFALVKPGAYLVNTARGEVVDEAALVAALRSSRLAGAALDVLAEEPPPQDQPLLHMPQVIVTSHIAGLTHESGRRTAEMVAANVLAVQRGERPPHPLNDLT